MAKGLNKELLLEIKGLTELSVAELKARWEDLFDKPAASNHKSYLLKRIAWKLQERQYGGLSEEAQSKLKSLMPEAEKQMEALRHKGKSNSVASETALPERPVLMAGQVLKRNYKGREIIVQCLEKGFDFEGAYYRSLTAITKEVTGQHWNGRLFFGLTQRKSKR